MTDDDPIKTTAEAAEADAMPRRHDAHSDPNADPGGPNALTKKPVQAKSPAEWAYERLILYIQNFEKLLDAEHEVAIGFTGSDAGVMRIEGMGFFDPDIVTFYGTDPSGAKTQLVQHVTQLSVMLRALPKPENAVEPQRIGFRLAADLEQQVEAGEAE
ncbi:DUF6173 family protein [Pseudooceanicola sp. LIPI14-2-Ac024]|uniref:DUF6173 family protein n=1 Tax=Pseudooceanicola sp. LIPI14-2-Ac024 TaxID=3344875 RepID=UPI0035CED7A9